MKVSPYLLGVILLTSNIAVAQETDYPSNNAGVSNSINLDDLQKQIIELQQKLSSLERNTGTSTNVVGRYDSTYMQNNAPVSTTAEAGESCGGCDSCFNSQCCSDGWLHQWDACKWVKLGAGLRTSYNAVEGGAPNGSSWSDDFNLDNMRIYISGQGHENIGFELNTDIRNAQFPEFGGIVGGETGGDVRIVDAVIKLKLNDGLNLWAGRLLPPSDRSNLDGPFFLNAWSFPYVQFGYQNVFQGREDGAVLWGELAESHVKWHVGLFEGRDSKFGVASSPNPRPVGAGTGKDNPMLAARLSINLLDPEPGYYNQSTYYGEKDIMSIGASFMHQRNAVGAPTDGRDYTAWNFDALYERKLGSCGVISVEMAYYDFDDNNAQAVDPGGAFTPLGRQGESYFILVSYLMPNSVGFGCLEGKLQPYFRYQDYDHDFGAAAAGAFVFEEGYDLGLNYIMEGHNDRLTAVWEQRDLGATNSDFDALRIGAQVQY